MANRGFIRSIQLDGFLSFAPGSPPVELESLNVLIGPNGSGKSNLLEAIELLRATPTAFADAIRDGGGVQEWLWKGDRGNQPARIEVIVGEVHPRTDLRYRLSFAASGQRTEVVDEAIEESAKRSQSEKDVFFYYRFQDGRPALNIRTVQRNYQTRTLRREDLKPDESVLSQRKDPDSYPEITWLGERFQSIQLFREWSFGRYSQVRQPQPADLPASPLLSDARNLGLLLNEIEHSDSRSGFDRMLGLFLPRYERFSTRVQGGTVQLYLHEKGLKAPIPATRLSDGTIRFMSIVAILLSPSPPPLVCIEEPELGLHPDAVALLAELLVDSAKRMQLVITTHSDELVSGLSEHPESVILCEYRNGTKLRRLERETLTYWLEKYRLGEVWRIGELGANP